MSRPDTDGDWLLEHFDPELRRIVRIPLEAFPFRVGRRHGLELPLSSPQISNLHAQIEREGAQLLLRDLGSTNGTFHDREPVRGAVPLEEGDIIHFASLEYRLRRRHSDRDVGTKTESLRTSMVALNLQNLLQETEALTRLLAQRAVRILFQPIFELGSGAVVAYEALGRGDLPELPETPHRLFEIADTVGSVAELSRLLRERAVETAVEGRLAMPLFLNAHAADLERGELVAELDRLRRAAPGLDLVLEISEQYGGGIDTLRSLRDDLHALGVRLAYDDFGSGLARVNELAEAPADFLKFDAALVAGIDGASDAKRRLLATLVDAARQLGMAPLAEGIETEPERAACQELGFELAQGFLLGRPSPLPPVG